ncbi:hypothetical protein JBE04_08340 [Streptomyces sp. PRKS01-29]|nr:hypothetical protein [Streptomyces sabulosicollis]MBI0294490.1 hypothetical protein [Streptomyces sabulosicollis]
MSSFAISTQLASGSCTPEILLTLLGVAMVIGGIWLIREIRSGGASDGGEACAGLAFGALLVWGGVMLAGGMLAGIGNCGSK